jgi:hypothetical protein
MYESSVKNSVCLVKREKQTDLCSLTAFDQLI